MMGPANTKAFLTMNDCQVVAACDLDKAHLQTALDTINGHYGNQDCKGYHDYREMLARDDIDAVMIAVPDQWHAIMATEAAKPQEGHLRREAAGADDRGAAGDRAGGGEEQRHLADGLVAEIASLVSTRRRRSCATG